MATKNSNNTTMNKNKETIKKVSAKVHEELLNTSHLFIDETVATLTRMQKITGKVIQKSEPILEKQIEMTFDAVEALANQASNGGKRALKLIGATKQFNKLTSTISKKVNAMPSTEEMMDNARELVTTAKNDVEKTFNKATESIKKVTQIGDTAQIDSKKVSITKSPKATAKKAVKKTVNKVVKTATTKPAKVKAQVKKAAAKASSIKTTAIKKAKATIVDAKATKDTKSTPVAKKKVTSATKKTVATKAKPVAKKATPVVKPVVKTETPVAKTIATPVAKKNVTAKSAVKKITTPESELTQIKGIGASLAAIMNDNGIKTINDLQNATPTALQVIAANAGNRYKSFDTNKWIDGAKAISK